MISIFQSTQAMATLVGELEVMKYENAIAPSRPL